MTDQMTNEKPAAAPEPDAHPETRQGLLLPILIPLGSFAIIGVVLFGFSGSCYRSPRTRRPPSR